MIEHLFDLVKGGPAERTLDPAIGPGPGWPEDQVPATKQNRRVRRLHDA